MSHDKVDFIDGIMSSILSYIDSRLPLPISMNDLQDVSGYSKTHLSRLFVRYTGVSPSRYLKIMQGYRLLLELKYTTISLVALCEKYEINDIRHLRKKLAALNGTLNNKLEKQNGISFNNILRNNYLTLPKRYQSCSFISLFDYDINARGVSHTIQRPINKLMSSNYQVLDNVVNDFSIAHALNRDDIWICARFHPSDTGHYNIKLHTCITGQSSLLSEAEKISLQGDYLCFAWAGNPEDTFPIIKNIYDHFFLKYMATRKYGYDIFRRNKVHGIENHYVFTYYIPVVINEAILSAIQ